MVVPVDSGVQRLVLKTEDDWLSDGTLAAYCGKSDRRNSGLLPVKRLSTGSLLWLIRFFTGQWSRPNIAGERNLVVVALPTSSLTIIINFSLQNGGGRG